MYLQVSGLDRRDRYRALTDVIVPRPVAWVLTDNGAEHPESDRWNLAPFSYFMGICSDPAQVMLSIGHSLFEGRARKDTYANMLERPECVIHIPSMSHVEDVEYTARVYEHGESELRALGLETTDFEEWPVPRLKDVSVAIACRAEQFIPVAVGESQMIVFASVEKIYIADAVSNGDNGVDLMALDPAARAGRGQYVGVRDPVVVERYPEGWSDRRSAD